MERIPVSTKEGYALWASTYDAYPNGLVALEEPRLRALLGPVEGRDVLDVACGTGRHSVWLADQGARVVGVDTSPEMLAVARAKRPHLDLREGSVDRLPVAEAAFDLAICALLCEHLPSLTGPFQAIARALRPGGAFALSVYHPFFLLKGVPPHFEHRERGVEYELPAHVHLVSDYLDGLAAADLRLEALAEPVVDDALVALLPRMAKHRGHPLAIVLRARKP